MKENLGNMDHSAEENLITRKISNADLAQEEYHFVSAGIRERPGRIPVWLLLVTISLLLWGSYYLATYWNPG